MNDLIINLALSGWIPQREQTPHVPLTVDETITDACSGLEAGASVLHIHSRTDDGQPNYDSRRYAEIIRGIRNKYPQAVITVTTSGRKTSDIAQRTAALSLSGMEKPDMASLTLGSMNFHYGASVNPPETIKQLAGIMQECDIKPELEVFDLGMINFAKYLIRKKLLKPPYYFNIILGNIATAQFDLLHLATLVRELPPESIWSVGGVGRSQSMANNIAAVLADGVRTGLEDNIWLDAERTRLASNTELVKRVSNLTVAAGRPIATPENTRQTLCLASI